ncbi:MAG TPA: phosphatase PAP2 family protein [Gaiellaceae bacterium]|nr:phosphatase PAP2 family protein [Gaiellaceae bacterium]
MGAVDPRVAVERDPAVPQPRNLGVAALVRRQRRAPEDDAGREREQRRKDRSERWGPPRADLDAGTIALAAAAPLVLLALAIGVFDLSLSPDRYALLLFVPALAIRRGRRFLLDFVPYITLIVLYAECRGLAHTARPDAYFTPHLDLERWLFGGYVPASVLQDWFWVGHERWHDRLALGISRIHQFIPLTLAFVLWMRRRALYFRFASMMVILSYAAAITFLLYPAAPPWHAAQEGLLTAEKIGGHQSLSASVWAPYDLVRGNPDAAVPSLHAGYAFLVFLFVSGLAWRTRWRVPVTCVAAVYPLLQSVAAVYTGNHYVVDLVIGYCYAAAVFIGVSFLWRRLRLPAAENWTEPGDETPAAGERPSRGREAPEPLRA